MKENKYQVLSLALVIMLICSLTLGYAALTQTLNINFGATVQSGKTTWDIHFENSYKSTQKVGNAEIGTMDLQTTTVTISNLVLKTKGDSVTYYMNVVNNGEVDAKISVVTPKEIEVAGGTAEERAALLSGFNVELKYTDGTPVQVNDTLAAKETKEMMLVMSLTDAAEIPLNNISISNIGYTLTYIEDNGVTGGGNVDPALNQYGFYFDKQYSTVIPMGDIEVKVGVTFYEDGSIYLNVPGETFRSIPNVMYYENRKGYNRNSYTIANNGAQIIHHSGEGDDYPYSIENLEGLELNEYGFYYNQWYTMDWSEDRAIKLLENGTIQEKNGDSIVTLDVTITYSQNEIVTISNEPAYTFSNDGKQCTILSEGVVLTVEE